MRNLISFTIVILSSALSLTAQEVKREVPLPFVTLVQPPPTPKLNSTPLTAERRAEIERLIAELSGLKSRDIGLLKTWRFETVFIPVGQFNAFGERMEQKVETFGPLRKLVEIGPDALPLLLEALEDNTPTELVIEAVGPEGAIRGGRIAFDEILHGNPVNPTERFILNLNRHPYSASIRADPFGPVANELESYRVKIGDACFVIVGQIVGRDYECLFHDHVKSLDVLVCSPVHRKSTREAVRRIWKTEHPRQRVLESLLLDFSTRGLLQRDSLDDWSIGSDIQIASAMRLLYYYPEAATAIVARRAAELRVDGDHFEDCVANGVRADDFIDAIGWSQAKEIRSALNDLGGKAKDNSILRALQRAGAKTRER